MRLKALDQISISAVKSDSLRPGEEFDVSDDFGADLIKRHPSLFERIAEDVEEKAETDPSNKAEGAAPANKASIGRKTKTKAS